MAPGYERRFGPVHEGIEGGVLELAGDCLSFDRCWYDHMLEFPLGVGVPTAGAPGSRGAPSCG